MQFWKTAKVVLPTPKEIVTMRLDADLLRWFRRERGYQTRINAILRTYSKRTSRVSLLRNPQREKVWYAHPLQSAQRMGHRLSKLLQKWGYVPSVPRFHIYHLSC